MLIDRLERLLHGYDPRSHDHAALSAAIATVKAAEKLSTDLAIAEMDSDPDWPRRPEDPACRRDPTADTGDQEDQEEQEDGEIDHPGRRIAELEATVRQLEGEMTDMRKEHTREIVHLERELGAAESDARSFSEGGMDGNWGTRI